MYVDVSVVVSAAPVRRTKARARASVASSEMRTPEGVSFRGFVTSSLSTAERHTVWSIFPADTKYFGDGAPFMINYRVKDLDAVLASLRREGVSIVPERQNYEYGRFAWITDPEGNRIELWEPPKTYRAPETATTME